MECTSEDINTLFNHKGHNYSLSLSVFSDSIIINSDINYIVIYNNDPNNKIITTIVFTYWSKRLS